MGHRYRMLALPSLRHGRRVRLVHTAHANTGWVDGRVVGRYVWPSSCGWQLQCVVVGGWDRNTGGVDGAGHVVC